MSRGHDDRLRQTSKDTTRYPVRGHAKSDPQIPERLRSYGDRLIMPIVKVKHPDQPGTFTFDWLPGDDRFKIKECDGNGGDVWHVLTREKARLTWANLYRAGFRTVRHST